MTSTFFGLEIARRGLQAQQRALDVTTHNVSNANTPGYTRQDAVMATTDPYPLLGMSVPSGA
ncbi:MAG: flagellar basal body protein, partial [Thermacetogeniaceae bacterium]